MKIATQESLLRRLFKEINMCKELFKLASIKVGEKFIYLNVIYEKVAPTSLYQGNVKRLDNGKVLSIHGATLVEKVYE